MKNRLKIMAVIMLLGQFFATAALAMELFVTSLPPYYLSATIPFKGEPRRVIMQLEIPDVQSGDCLIIDATAQISARDPWNVRDGVVYKFPGPSFLASQIFMYATPMDVWSDAPLSGDGVIKITHPNGVNLDVWTSIPYVQPTLHGVYIAPEYLGTQWIALVMWARSEAAGPWDYLRVFPDNHASITVQRFDAFEC